MYKKLFKPQWKEFPNTDLVMAQWNIEGKVYCSEYTLSGGTVTGGWKHEAS